MAIKEIGFKGNEIIDGGSISFVNSNIVSIVGINGSGKTILLNHLRNDQIKYKQIFLKEDMDNVESEILDIFDKGNHQKKALKYISEVKEDGLKDVDDVFDKFDDMIWDMFLSAYKSSIEASFNTEKSKIYIKALMELKKGSFFSEEIILEEVPEIEDVVHFGVFEELVQRLNNVKKSRFGSSKIVTIDMLKEVVQKGIVQKNGLGNPSLAQTMKTFPLLIRLVKVANLENKIKDNSFEGNIFTDKALEKINTWFTSYISQDIKINIIYDDNYHQNYTIVFREGENIIAFENLSKGTQNLIKIISQLSESNSETIIQIDEPETGMHPLMQIQFREFLEDLTRQKNVRIIIYTHSTHLVKDGYKTKGLYIMSRSNGKSSLYSKNEYINNESILDIQIFDSIGLVPIDNQDSFNKNDIHVIVEGETDVIYLTKMKKTLGYNDIKFLRTRTGGAPNMCKTSTLLQAVHDIKLNKIILSPDMDIINKHKKLYTQLQDGKSGTYIPLGVEARQDVEGMFDQEKDKKYIASLTSNSNRKINKANLFWRTVTSKDQLSDTTIENFNQYFKKIIKAQNKK